MPVRRMRSRVAGATVVSAGHVRHRQFVYHKRGIDGSAKANALFTGQDADFVWGVVYRLTSCEKSILDGYETLGVGYDHQQVDVIVERGVVRAWIYVARREAIDNGLLPYSWYHRFVIEGAKEHGLPQSYLDQLRSFESIEDPDTERHHRNRRLIG